MSNTFVIKRQEAHSDPGRLHFSLWKITCLCSRKVKKNYFYFINKLNVFADKIGWARGADSAG